jgi:hypothetical protein
MPSHWPNSHAILSDLRDGPQRASVLKQRYGPAMRHTITLLRRELPPGYSIKGKWTSIRTKFGVIVDYIYRLEVRR